MKIIILIFTIFALLNTIVDGANNEMLQIKELLLENGKVKAIKNDISSNIIPKMELFYNDRNPGVYATIENIGINPFNIHMMHLNFAVFIKKPNKDWNEWGNPDQYESLGYICYESNKSGIHLGWGLDKNSRNSYYNAGDDTFHSSGNYEFSWKVYQNDDRTGKEWTSNKLIVNIDEKGEVTLIDDLPSPDWTDEQITEHLQKYENLENEKHIAKTFTEKIKNLNLNKPKEDSDKAISELQKNETSKSKIFIIFGVLFTIILGGCLVCEHKKKKKNRKQEEK